MSNYNVNFLELTLVLNESCCPSQLNHLGFFFFTTVLVINSYYWLLALIPSFTTKTTIINAIVVTIKFVLLIALLVFVRGGIPRYRYDFLTKVGWIKFLSLILAVFLSSLLLTYIM